ncbi:NAD(P)/FAD-dependent oxidoreductase [Spongiactinospora sp. TRM90649]|uniref:dihydrolipoyl dehydrogenase family protein n=1 Tax=Spongiactinospora sp. TRM90649 TaxID=3031114 RepID=UPI0023F7C627|nr:NAD(P)/FAD-dependent oxidoreductase [Spongiactinospora sp. TRM90649]MDF5752058.1 NAD(P)/FAD-dependent oxidoreductase [Spongiactinospora sp. TRM90649]
MAPEPEVPEYDVIVLGMGPGGEEVAQRLAEAGLSVAGVEANLVGGECPYWGCVPSKMMVRAAGLLAEARRVPGMAGEATVVPDWAPVALRIREEATAYWDDKAAVTRFTGKGGHFFRGRGAITAPGEVTIGGERVLRARRGIVVATGSRAAVPPVPGLGRTPYWTNREAIETDRCPRSLIVLGGGAIGAELAQVFARFGARVSIVEASPRLLSMEEPEAGDLVSASFAREGIDVRLGARAVEAAHDGRRFILTLDGGSVLTAERLLVATGRRVDLTGLGLGAAGIDERGRSVPVDDRMRAAPGVWALGDVVGLGGFTHVAVYQAGVVVRDILGEDGPGASYHAVPRVAFTDPEVGAVGLTEAQARSHGLAVRAATVPLHESSRGWIHKTGNDGLIKLVESGGVLVGATSAGPCGGEVLGALAVAVHARVPIATLRQMIFAFPTFHRALEPALRSLEDPVAARPGT